MSVVNDKSLLMKNIMNKSLKLMNGQFRYRELEKIAYGGEILFFIVQIH